MCADEARAVSYRHTPDIGWLKVPLPAGRRLVETSREVPDTLAFSFRWRYPGGLPSIHSPPDKAQANLEGQTFRQAPRNFHQTNNRGARPTQLSGSARAGRRLPCLCRHTFRNLSYVSKPARTCRFCAKRFFLLDRPRPVLFLSRTKREWGVESPRRILRQKEQTYGFL